MPGVASQIATELLSDAGNERAGLTASVVVASPDGSSATLSDPSNLLAIDDLRSDLGSLDSVVGVAPAQISPDRRVALLTIHYPILEELDASDVDRLIEVVEGTDAGDAIDVEVGGDLLQAFDDGGGDGAEMIGLAVAVIVLLVAFGSLIAMGLPIGMALAGLALGVSAMALVAHLIEVPSWAPQMGTMIGLGVGIDYALFVVTRHRENLAEGRSIVDAAAHAKATGDEEPLAEARYLLGDWRKLTTGDHFYYMCTKYFADGDVHKYFNPYDSPYDSYINFMNVLDNVRSRAAIT